MKLRNFFALLLSMSLALQTLIPVATAESASPKTEIEQTINDIIKTVATTPDASVSPVRRQKLRELINPKFNFAEMSKRSLGPNWNEISAQEQAEFTEVFSELLARTYLSKIETVKPGMVKVESENVEPPKAVVKTIVISKGDTFPIDYKLIQKDGGSWQVYDVVIENIGLVANYRNEFSGIIRKDTFAGLMEKLRAKIH
jgi:phospholipid transport system substrate-binding protein